MTLAPEKPGAVLGLTLGLPPVNPVWGLGVTLAPEKPGAVLGLTLGLPPVTTAPGTGVTKLGLQSGTRQQGSLGLGRSWHAGSSCP